MQASKTLEEGSLYKSTISQAQAFHTQSTSTNTANLKGKLNSLEDMIKTLAEELNYHKREVQLLRAEKETLESVLTLKTQEVRKALTNENFKVEEEMKRHYAH